MEQTDQSTLLVMGLYPQTQQTKNTDNKKSDGTSGFQDLLEQRCQTSDGTGETPKTAVVSDKQQKDQPQAQQQEDDPVARQLACAQMAAATAIPVELVDVQTAPAETQLTGTVAPEALLANSVTAEATSEAVLPEEPQTGTIELKAETPLEVPTEANNTALQDPTEVVTAPVQTETAQTEQQETDLPAEMDEKDTVKTETVPQEAQPIFRDVESTMIKVGEAPRTESTAETASTEDLDAQVAQQLTDGLSQGETKVELQLTPSSLGKVTVEVTAQTDGTLHITLSAENSHTRALLQQHTESLQTLLGSQEQRTVRVDVSQRQEDQQQDNLQDHHNGGGQKQQEQRRQQAQHGEDFLQRLRLGLVPVEAEE